MSKAEFLKLLEEKLQVLESQEIEDILEEYTNHIDEKIRDGKTEEEAIQDFGDLDELAREILSAYKINQDYVKKEKTNFEKIINTMADEMTQFFKKLVEVFNHKKGEDLVRIICKIVIIFLIIWALHFPFYLVERLGSIIFMAVPYVLRNVFSGIWVFMIELAYLVVSVLLLYVSIKKMILEENISFAAFKEKVREEPIPSPSEQPKKKKKAEQPEVKKKDSILYEEKISEQKVVYRESNSEVNIISTVFNPLVWILKIFVVFLTFPIFAVLIGLFIVFGIFIALLFKGIYVISLFLIIFGLIMIVSSILGIIYHITFPKGGR